MLSLTSQLNLAFDHGQPYKGLPPHRPLMTLELAAIDRIGRLLGNVTTVVLIDSGADTSMLNADLAVQLGVDLSTASPVVVEGVGGQTNAYAATLLARLCSQWLPLPVLFEVDRDTNLLGREGAFDAMRIAFLHAHHIALATLEP